MESRFANLSAAAKAAAIAMALSAALVAMAGRSALAQGSWKPERVVELIVPVSPGGTVDTRARTLQAIWKAKGIVDVPVNVVNKAGGGHAIAANYLLSKPEGDGHYLGLTVGTLLTSKILKNHDVDYTQATPLAFLGDEYYVWVVKADSDIKSGEDLFARLRKDPTSVVIGASNPGGLGHIQTLSVLKEAGVDIGKIKIVTFAGGGETRTALLGNHIGVTATSASNMAELVRGGTVRAVAVNAPRRIMPPFADTPTLKEMGIDSPSYMSGWTVVLGPKNLTRAQIAYWQNVFAETMKTEEWKADAASNLRDLEFKDGEGTRATLQSEYAAFEKMIEATIGAPH